MLEWEVSNGDKKLKKEIKRVKSDFDRWFNNHWAKVCSREKMLSEDSPVPHIYHKMCKPFKEVKRIYPHEAKEKCSSCEELVDEWIETSFSFCDEYGCGMYLCKKCAAKLNAKISNWLGSEAN